MNMGGIWAWFHLGVNFPRDELSYGMNFRREWKSVQDGDEFSGGESVWGWIIRKLFGRGLKWLFCSTLEGFFFWSRWDLFHTFHISGMKNMWKKFLVYFVCRLSALKSVYVQQSYKLIHLKLFMQVGLGVR